MDRTSGRRLQEPVELARPRGIAPYPPVTGRSARMVWTVIVLGLLLVVAACSNYAVAF